ncbi:MAG: hypothetical protein DCC57_16350 [Chloroflexi bacterium]|nr:MAG: hypothetical protein DCC57_16350 [Chloroflexota bacterium]
MTAARIFPRRRAVHAAFLPALLVALLGTGTLYAQTPNRAGLVVVHGDGSVIRRCVEFDGESISGYELLERSGLDLRMEVSGMGPTICAIDQEGCGAGEHCFCRCLSSPCEYWSYWRLEDGGWRYASVGAGNTQVSDGMVEAWVWSEGNMQKGTAQQPPDLTLDAICQAQPAAAPAPRASEPDSAPDHTPERLAGPMGLLLVLGAPLLAAAGWWVARQSRKAPQGERHEQ